MFTIYLHYLFALFFVKVALKYMLIEAYIISVSLEVHKLLLKTKIWILFFNPPVPLGEDFLPRNTFYLSLFVTKAHLLFIYLWSASHNTEPSTPRNKRVHIYHWSLCYVDSWSSAGRGKSICNRLFIDFWCLHSLVTHMPVTGGNKTVHLYTYSL